MRRALAVLILAFAACKGGGDGTTDGTGSLAKAMDHYKNGRFPEAEQELQSVAKREPENVDALRLLGRVLVLRNKLTEAVEALRKAIAIKSKEKQDISWRQEMLLLYQELAVAYYRRDDFGGAAEVYHHLGEGVLVGKYQALAAGIAYVQTWNDDVSVLEFVGSDPVPTVRVRVNDERGVFAIDTSSGEMVLDPAFAARAGVKTLGVRGEQFTDPMEEGFVRAVQLGSVQMRNVPVRMRKLPPRGKQEIDGILGTNFLLHFTFTIDYKRDQLVLRPGDKRPSRAGTEIPFYVAGERFIVIPGRLVLPEEATQREHAIFFFVNTGLSKTPIAPSQGLVYTLARHMKGKLRFSGATFGSVTLENPTYDSGTFPSGLDTAYGFTIGAAVGHEAFRGRALTFEPGRMILTIE